MSEALKELRDTLDELVYMHQLNLELLEQLDVIFGWLLENKIPILNRDTIDSLLAKARTLLDEIHSKRLSDEFSHKKPSDEDYTEP